MVFHLFGVTQAQAETLHAKHGDRWATCGKTDCGKPAEAAFLVAARDGIVCATTCEEHEGDALAVAMDSAGVTAPPKPVQGLPRGAAWVCPDGGVEH